MEREVVVKKKTLSPTGLVGAAAPVLALLASNRLPSYQVALLQLVTIFLVQVLSIFIKTESAFIKKKILDAPKLERPIKVQVVQPDPVVPVTAQRVIKPTVQAPSLDMPAVEQPKVLESQVSTSDLIPEQPKRPVAKAIQEHPLYSNESIDTCLKYFLSVVDPSQLGYLTEGPDTSSSLPAPLPMPEWEQLLTTDSCRVAKHPSIPHLYSVSVYYPDIPLRNLYEVLTNIENRPSWDSMCAEAVNIDSIGELDQSDGATRQATISYMATKGMFPVKAQDMVMLSVNARLLPKGPIRVVCATTSVEHPSKPVTRSYTRLKLTISGFLAEQDESGGTRITQIADLSALGSWVPGRLIKMVTETLLPKSLVKIGDVARAYTPPPSLAAIKGDAWLPPVIGSWEGSTGTSSASEVASNLSLEDSSTAVTSDHASDDLAKSDSAEESLDGLPASTARDVRELVGQLRSINNRLSTLERLTVSGPSSTPSGARTPVGGYHPPAAPMGVSKVTESSLSGQAPMGWMARLASTLNIRSFISGLGAGIFSTTSAATIAALAVFWLRRKKMLG